MQTLSEIMAEEEARRLAETRAEVAAEKAAWDALTPEEQAAAIAAREAKYADLPAEDDHCDHCRGYLDEEGYCPDCGED